MSDKETPAQPVQPDTDVSTWTEADARRQAELLRPERKSPVRQIVKRGTRKDDPGVGKCRKI